MEYEKHPLFQELLGNRCFLRVYRPFHLLLADIYFLFHHGIKSSWQASLENILFFVIPHVSEFIFKPCNLLLEDETHSALYHEHTTTNT